MFSNDSIQTYSFWSVQDDRDRSRIAAERYFLLHAAEQRPRPVRRSWLRRVLGAVVQSAVIRRRAEA